MRLAAAAGAAISAAAALSNTSGVPTWNFQMALAAVRAKSGEDEKRAQEFLADLERVGGSGSHTFERVDGSSTASTKDFSKAFLASQPTVDVLVLTHGIATIQGRTETPEGLDQ
jgi:NAD(P)-dependent dehydrogenase (short-subunit alcohol dehydrogenase family)